MIYDNENTGKLVSHLITQSTTLNRITRAFWIFSLGILAAVTVAFFARDYWWLGGLIGILLGYGFGFYLASIQNLVIEWKVQTLIAQREILDRLKKFTE